MSLLRKLWTVGALGGLLVAVHTDPSAAQTGTIELDRRTYVLAPMEAACSSVRCPEGHVCLQGRCMLLLTESERRCLDVECPKEQVCYQGTCFQTVPKYCEGRDECPSGEVCLSGACVAVETDVSPRAAACGAGGVLWKGRCLPVDEATRCPFACREGEICLPGGCYALTLNLGGDACAGVSCPDGWPCLGGECMKPNDRLGFDPCESCLGDSRCVKVGELRYCVFSNGKD